MKYQSVFYERKNKKMKISLSSAEFVQSVVKVEHFFLDGTETMKCQIHN